MATTEVAIPATEITVTTATVTEPTPTVTTPPAKNIALVYKVNKKIDKNDPDRFKGEGISFNAKLIGIEEVPDARGDKMCQEKIHKLKADVKASGLHKQRIIVNVSEEGIKIVDVRHGVVEHSHPVHKVSFISRDMSDSRAFGYIFSTEDKKHQFYAIKTEKASEAVVLTLRDLFQIIFERKKREMEEAKKQQQTETKPPEEKQDPNVIKLDGELTTESNTDEEPVYSVPQNNKPVQQSAGNSLVDLESELENLGQGIEQMNKLETFFESEHPPTSSPSNDPWTTPGGEMPKSSSSSDLQDLDLFGNKPASPIDKKSILGLFGNQPTMPPNNPNMLHPGFGAQPGFGAPQPGFGQPSQPGFGQPVQPGFGQPSQPGFGQPGMAAPAANPFGAQPMPGTPAPFATNPVASGLPAVPQRPGFGATPNPFGAPTSSAFPTVSNDPFGEPVLAPVKMTPDQQGRDSPKPPADAFGDLCEIGTKNTDKSPKQLFAEKNAPPKKKINEMLSPANQPAVTQASSGDPFGNIDTTSALPEAADFHTTVPASHDPFDTSYINNPQIQPASILLRKAVSDSQPNQLTVANQKDDSDSDNFDLPSPEGPPPPLPPERKIDKISTIPPAPPPRPNSTPVALSNQPNAPVLPPRNIPPQSQKTSIKPVPRPRPQNRAILKESHSSPSNLNSNTQLRIEKIEENNNLTSSPSSDDKLSMNSSNSSHSSGRYVIEDPFENNDPFADCDPFNSSDGFSNVFDSNSKDPFAISLTSQTKGQKNGTSVNTDDPFAVFDKSFGDPFSFKSNGVQKNIKVSTDKSQPPTATDPFDTFFK